MVSKSKMQESIKEIYKLFRKRNVIQLFTLESINDVFEIGNEVFLKNNPEEMEKLSRRTPSKAPDIMDDEPFSFDRTIKIFNRLNPQYKEISPELIKRIFEVNSQLAWEAYRKRYNKYIVEIYEEHPDDEYVNYLAAIVLFDQKNHEKALKCINIALSHNPSSANYTHIKGLCLMQTGEFESARTYFYQALFLVELMQDIPPRLKDESDIYPNYPVEFHTSTDLIRSDLRKLDKIDNIYQYEFLPLIDFDPR